MMKNLYLIVFLSHIFTANIHFNPIVKLAYYSEGSDRFNESTPISIFGAGLNVNYHTDNVFIDAIFMEIIDYGVYPTRMKHNYNALIINKHYHGGKTQLDRVILLIMIIQI